MEDVAEEEDVGAREFVGEEAAADGTGRDW